MQPFREQNRFLMYLVNFSGLYLKSIERFIRNKWILYFLTVWTKIAITFIPVYLVPGVVYLLFAETSIPVKVSVFRRMLIFFVFFSKNVYFYLYRKQIEDLIDLWDSYFAEKLFEENREEKFRISQRRTLVILIFSWILTVSAAMVYTIPTFFSPTKTLNYQEGIPYRHQSPDFEIMSVYDFFRVTMGCSTSAAFDCILMVFLSHAHVQLTHLRDSLADLVDEITLDAHGDVTYKRRSKSGSNAGENVSYVTEATSSGDAGTEFRKRRHEEAVREFDVKMRIWILHHQQVIRFFEGIRNLYSPIASIQLLYVVIYTCFTAFYFVRVRIGLELFVIPIMIASNLNSLFIWCFIGYQVEQVSSEIFSDAFGRCWFLYPRKIQRIFSFIAVRGWKSLILKGISLFDLNLFTFFQVFKITYQMFAFMLQVAREE